MKRLAPGMAAALAGLAVAGCLAGSTPTERQDTADSLASTIDTSAAAAADQSTPIDVTNVEPAPWLPMLGPPRRGAEGRLVWGPHRAWIATDAALAMARLQARDGLAEADSVAGDSRARADSLHAWAAIPAGSRLRPYADHRSSRLRVLQGDELGTADRTPSRFRRRGRDAGERDDPLGASMRAIVRLWDWEAMQDASAWLATNGHESEIDSLLESVETRWWPEKDRAEWLLARAKRRQSAADSSGAALLARRALLGRGRHATRRDALDVLVALRGGRVGGLRADESFAAAELALRPEAGPPDLPEAERRLGNAFRDGEGELMLRAGLRLGETQRRRRRYHESLSTFARALRSAASTDDSARVLLGRARTQRNARRRTAARATYERVANGRAALALRESAWWEMGRMAEGQRWWKHAREAYRSLNRLGGKRADDGALRGGLTWLSQGHRDSALAWFERGADEGSSFWRAVLLRSRGDPTGDRLLRALADEPGYGFYSHAARETLGVRGWPGEVRVVESCEGGVQCEPLGLARDLAALGAHEDALRVLDAWADVMRRHAGDIGRNQRSHSFLHAAQTAFAAGGVGPATLYAFYAGQLAPSAERSWQIRPWRYPPAHDALFAALPDSADADGIERALMQGLAWQESKFDAAAVSRANARGLVQLMMPTARDVARWLGEPRPVEDDLFDPDRNLRYGVRYMRYLLQRFDHNVAVALAAYNGGPGRISKRWKELRAHGGDALLCEMVSVTASNNYAKRVLSLRQAYREMRPTTGP